MANLMPSRERKRMVDSNNSNSTDTIPNTREDVSRKSIRFSMNDAALVDNWSSTRYPAPCTDEFKASLEGDLLFLVDMTSYVP